MPSPASARVLIVDLNNFARYPTIPVGYLAAICRREAMHVAVFSPLSIGVRGVTRERPVSALGLPIAKLGYLTAVSSSTLVRSTRARLASRRLSQMTRKHEEIVVGFVAALARERPGIVMISTYLMYRELTARLCTAAAEAGVATLIGGPYFSQPAVIDDWIGIPGLTALAAGELELEAPTIARAMIAGEDLSIFPGLVLPSADRSSPLTPRAVAPPLHDLDRVPFPDYSDFPWDRYPQRIVPIITGRGCAWGACTFCSDVTSTAGRSFRSRSLSNVLDEIRRHHETLGVRMFVFTDLKLNSNPAMWRGLIAGIQSAAPGATWVAAVHVHDHADNGCSVPDLCAAADAGCVRLTTGLESGSQRVLDAMHKGTRLERTAQYLHDATAAGISTRCTMIVGYPGERPVDAEASGAFLRAHAHNIERISLNRLAITLGTGLDKMLRREPKDFPDIAGMRPHSLAQFEHRFVPASDPPYRRAVMSLLEAVHAINRRPLSPRAREFEGVM